MVLENKYNFLKNSDIDNLEVIHYGNNKYLPDLLTKIENNSYVKPIGGLWTSPVNSNYGWNDWCKGSDFRENCESNSFKLKFNLDSKIIIIDDLSDLLALPMLDYHIGTYKCSYPDFETISTLFDAVWLTEKGVYETHCSHPVSLYGWDCESVLIFNKDCCYQI